MIYRRNDSNLQLPGVEWHHYAASGTRNRGHPVLLAADCAPWVSLLQTTRLLGEGDHHSLGLPARGQRGKTRVSHEVKSTVSLR